MVKEIYEAHTVLYSEYKMVKKKKSTEYAMILIVIAWARFQYINKMYQLKTYNKR